MDAYTARCLYKKVRDHDIAIDALLMHPRPEWLEKIVGPHPHPPTLGELTNHLDIADLNEWGHAG